MDAAPMIPQTSQSFRNNQHEPIAIIGMGCRFPGGVYSPSQLWDLLREGRSGHSNTIPASRFSSEGFYHPDRERPGSINATGGYFLDDDPREFENSFFGINNLEATYMDPQQRKLLEVAYESFESAGYSLERISGANVGCYVANFTADFLQMQAKDPENYHRYSATGMGITIIGNRISHTLNLKGPSFTLDTACSSSLYALHLACAALDVGECDSAVVAGSNLILSPEIHLGAVKAGILSDTATCHSFDSSADGYGRAEGVGALYLKRLSDALKDGDPIRSVIRGTAVNSNGKTNGITLPSADGQEMVIRKAYAKAGLPTDETDYVETHTTGTPVGDPIEVEALSRVLHHKSGRPTLIGTVKSNLGHSEAVSGICSIIKVTLALEHGVIPPTIGIKNLNPALRLNERNVEVVTKLTDWPRTNVRRASVNSFGYGGANAHAILEAAEFHIPPEYNVRNLQTILDRKFVLPFSAHSDSSLESRIADLSSSNLENVDIIDLAHTLSLRSNLSIRGFLLAQQETLAKDVVVPNLRKLLTSSEGQKLPLAFVFTGQGAQWPRMGYELMEQFSTYRNVIEDLDAHLSTLEHAPTWKIKDSILEPAETSMMHTPQLSQTVCTAIQIALVVLLKEWNVAPVDVVGHSSGEIAAAFAAGYLTTKEALTIAYYRGLVVSKSLMKGSMIAVGLDRHSASLEILSLGIQDHVRVACVNSPESVTISGDAKEIDELITKFNDRGVFVRKLKTDGKAYHSHHMSIIGREYEDLIFRSGFPIDRELVPNTPRMFSSVTGDLVSGTTVCTPNYWRTNLESPVLFQDAIEALLKNDKCHFIEIGPHSALELPIKQISAGLQLSANQKKYSSTLSRGKNSVDSILNLAGTLYLHGNDISFRTVNAVPSMGPENADITGQIIYDLPRYRWHYGPTVWYEPRRSSEFRNRKYPRHDLLGSLIVGGTGEVHSWRNVIHEKDVPWLKDHKLNGEIVFPGAGYIAIAMQALFQVQPEQSAKASSFIYRQIKFLNALILSQTSQVEMFTQFKRLQLSETSQSSTWWHFEISSYIKDISTVHANGQICLSDIDAKMEPFVDFPDADMKQQSSEPWYRKLQDDGFNFGPSFQSMVAISTPILKNIYQATAEICHENDNKLESNYVMHPIIIDSLLQTMLIASAGGIVDDLHVKVPFSIGHLEVRNAAIPIKNGLVKATSEVVGFGTINGKADFLNTDGQILLQMSDVRAIANQGGLDPESSLPERTPIFQIIWKPEFSSFSSGHNKDFTDYLDRFSAFPSNDSMTMDTCRLAGTLDLLAHSSLNLRILEIGQNNQSISEYFLRILNADTKFKRFQSYTQGFINGHGLLEYLETQSNPYHQAEKPVQEIHFDLVVFHEIDGVKYHIEEQFEKIKQYLAPVSKILLITDDSQLKYLKSKGLTTISTMAKETPNSAVVSPARKKPPIHPKPDALHGKVLRVTNPLSQRSSASDLETRFAELEARFADLETRFLNLRSNALSPVQAASTITVAQHRQMPNGVNVHGLNGTENSRIVLVEREGEEAFGDILESSVFNSLGHYVDRIYLHNVSSTTVPPSSTVFSTVELSKPLFQDITSAELECVKALTDNAATIIWITGGGLFKSQRPEFSIVNGVARTVMLEQPTTQFFVLDVDKFTDTEVAHSLWVLDEARHNPKPQFEFLCYAGVLYTSRIQGEKSLNQTFQTRHNSERMELPLRDAGHCSLAIGTPGLTDTLYFSQHDPLDNLAGNLVEVETKCVSLNAKDILVLSGKVDAQNSTCALEFTGVVSRVGPDVTDLAPGDRVVVMAPNRFSTHEIVPHWACCKLNDDEDFRSLSSIPIVFATAIHALQNLARLEKGESVLIHAGAGGVGIAAIQIAQLIGAEIFVTVGNEAKKQFLVDEFQLNRDHIFDSHGTTFLPALLAATSGRGVDVVLNSLTKDQLQDSFSAIAEFGRFVEIGKKDIVEGGKLDMGVFKRSATFSAFDLSGFYNSNHKAHHQTWSTLLKQVIQMFREKKINPVHPLKVFDISEISQAYRHLSLRSRMGKIVVSLENLSSSIPVLPCKYTTRFDPLKSYVMVGGLGGIGRSLTTWMFSRGARRFAFLNRSGADSPKAAELVKDLQALGAEVHVIRGNVSVLSDVEAAFGQLSYPIGGIVLAAMGLQEILWTSMTSEAWHKSLDPKVKGALNLHQALQGRDSQLDFFLLLSSMSGSLGTATEANYCSANAFLDAFAKYRRSIGLPAIAVGLGIISEVGYLHEHPEIEKLLLRKGIQPINELETLQICDLALSAPAFSNWPGRDHFAEGHLLTGLETQGMVKIRKQGFEALSHVLDDPRADILANALFDEYDKATQSKATEKENSESQLSSIGFLNPDGSIATCPTDPALLSAIEIIVAQKISDLLLLSAELNSYTPLGTFGMDSMLAADSRHFIFHTFHVDIPFLMLLAPSTTVASLAQTIASQLHTRSSK